MWRNVAYLICFLSMASVANADLLHFDITDLATYTPEQGPPGGNWVPGSTSGTLLDTTRRSARHFRLLAVRVLSSRNTSGQFSPTNVATPMMTQPSEPARL